MPIVVFLFLLTGALETCGVLIFKEGDDWDILLAVGIVMLVCLPIFLVTGYVILLSLLQ